MTTHIETDRCQRAWPIARVTAVFAILVLMLAACGGGGDDNAADLSAEEPAATQAAAPEAAPTTEAATPQTGETTGSGTEAAVAERMTAEELEEELGPVPEPSSDYRIGAIEKTLVNEHWQQMQQGYQDAAEEHGVEVVVNASQDETDLTGQLAVAENMLGQGFDAFGVSPLSESNLEPFLESARQQDIPIVNVDDARIPARTFVGSDHRQMGVLAAQEMAERLPDGGKVAQVEGQAGSPAAQQRIDGFTAELGNYDKLELVASVPADWDRSQALDVTTNLLRENEDLAAIYANNDTMALGVAEAVRNADRAGEVIVIGTDGVPEAIDAIREGSMTGTIASFPYAMGQTALEVAIRILEGQPVPDWVVSRQEMVTEDNVDEAFPQ